MTPTFQTLLPMATVYHLGIFREKAKLMPAVEYYNKLPKECTVDIGFILDPQIATAGTKVLPLGTAIAAVNILQDWGLRRIVFCSLVVSRSGLKTLREAHPNIGITVGVIDEEMSEDGSIIPGVGDMANRLFKT